jgi:hypothetical protein
MSHFFYPQTELSNVFSATLQKLQTDAPVALKQKVFALGISLEQLKNLLDVCSVLIECLGDPQNHSLTAHFVPVTCEAENGDESHSFILFLIDQLT